MKPFLAFALVVFATVTSLFAQAEKTPTVQDVPTLQEWWRADNLRYGINGMTWIDNFYNGKGALVISTPKGVQTWQLRFPWDTVNVFTWSGGDANITVADYNGDSILDYLDTKGNLYIGQATGFPQPPKIIFNDYLNEHIITDINNDGITDVVSLDTYGGISKFFVRLGTRSDTTLQGKVLPIGKFFDSTRTVAGYYTKPGNEQRLIVRYLPYHIDKTNNIITEKDGYELYSLTWDNALQQIKLSKLSEQIVNNTTQSWIISKTFQPGADRIYRIQAERVDLNDDFYSKTNLVIYDLSNDAIDKISETRMDRIAGIYGLAHSIDKDSVQDWFIKSQDGWTCNIYSGISLPALNLMGTAKVCHANYVCSTAPVRSPNYSSLCIGGTYFSSGDESSCWSIINLPDSVVSVSETYSDIFHLSLRVLPTPTEQSNYPTVEITSDKDRICNLFLIDVSGKELLLQRGLHIIEGASQVAINNPYVSSAGQYFLRLTDGKLSVECPVFIK